MTKIQILTIEDNTDIRKRMNQMLEGAGYACIEAADGIDNPGRVSRCCDIEHFGLIFRHARP